MDIGTRMKDFRMKADLTLKQVSEQTGLSISFLSDMERNITDPSIETVQRLCNLWDVSLSRFFEGVHVQVGLTRSQMAEIMKEYE